MQPATLHIDPANSHAAFAVRLIWLQTIHGRFSHVRGRVHIDQARQLARVTADIAVDSVHVRPAHYRKVLLGEKFFNARAYPSITFTSAPLAITHLRKRGHLLGHLRMHGITQPMTLQIVSTQCPSRQTLAGCTLHLRGWLDRTRFGMHAHRTLVANRVALNLVIRIDASAVQHSPAPDKPTRQAVSG